MTAATSAGFAGLVAALLAAAAAGAAAAAFVPGSLVPRLARVGLAGVTRVRRARAEPTAGVPGARVIGLATSLVMLLVLPFSTAVPVVTVLTGLAGLVLLGPTRGVAQRRRQRGRRLADLAAAAPLTYDLVAACLAGGADVRQALGVVAHASPAPVRDELAGVVSRLDLGASPDDSWSAVLRGGPDHPLLPLARAVVRASESGAALVPVLSGLADQERARLEAVARARIERAGVFVLLPLGVCFLPAFLLVGIFPVIAAGAATLLGRM